MFHGYYNLTSSMLTQTRQLNVISSNMANVSTAGYKTDNMTNASFAEKLVVMSGDKSQQGAVEVGSLSGMVYADRNYTDYAQGSFVQTGMPLDFALLSEGFFVIQGTEGNVYTRNGSFSLDEERYLTLQGVGRVLGTNGAPIQINSDNIVVDNQGNIYDENNNLIARLSVVDFENYDENLLKSDSGTFTAPNGGAVAVNATIMNQGIEGSNVDSVTQMSKMMASNRALQSSAQIFTMYDQLISKIVNDIGQG